MQYQGQFDTHKADRQETEKSGFSALWKIARICFAIAALIFIIRSIQYNDILYSDSARYELASYDKSKSKLILIDQNGATHSFTVIRAPNDVKENLFIVRDATGLEHTLKYKPGAKTLINNIHIATACLGILIFGLVPIFLALRWRTLLSVIGITITFFRALNLTFAGRLMNFFFISTTGGDLFKAYWVSKDNNKRAEAFVSVFVDRFLGLAFLILFSSILVLIFWNDSHVSRLLRPIGGLVLMLSIAISILFSTRVRKLIRFDKWKYRLPFSSIITKIDNALLMFRSAGNAMLKAGIYTAILQLASSLSTYFLGHSLNINASVWYFLLYVPLAFLIGSIPISIFWGLGLMEGAYVIFFAGSGFASPTQAAMLAMGTRLIQLFWSLPGAFVLMSGLHNKEYIEGTEDIKTQNTQEA